MLISLLAACSGEGAVATPPAATLDTFFGTEQVHDLRLEIDEAGIASLVEEPRTWVHAAVVIDGVERPDVGVRIKGGAGSYVPLDGDDPDLSGDGNGRPGKSAFIVDFNRYEPGGEFLGLQKLTVNNMVQDPSGIHEQVGYALFRTGGVPTCRAGYAAVRLNDEEKGLYALIESTDNSEFLERWYGTDAGNLYEGEYGVDFYADMIDLFDQDNGSDDSRADLEALVAALDAAETDDDVFEALQGQLDLEEYLAFAATELYLGHWDGYAWSPNNFKVHKAPGLPWTFLPWGIDQLFEDWMGPYAGVFRAPGPSWDEGGRMQRECFRSEACRAMLLDAFAALLERVETEDLADLAREARAVVEPLLLAEAEEWGDPALTEAALDQVELFLADRSAGVEEWLPCLAGGNTDFDGDGHDGCTEDCDDGDPDVHPGAAERCNFVDDDCNGLLDEPEHCPQCRELEGADGGTFALCLPQLDWEAAREWCQGEGGDLASIHDGATWDQLTWEFYGMDGTTGAWIGLNDRFEEGVFTWSDGSGLDTDLWAKGAPSDDGEDRDCVLSTTDGWWDQACADAHPFVCRID